MIRRDGFAKMSSGLSAEQMVNLQQFYAAQAHAIDEGDAEGWARTFTPEGSFYSPTYGVPIVGYSALKDFAGRFYVTSGLRQHRHWLNNIAWGELKGGIVKVRAYALILATDPDSPPVMLRSSVFSDHVKLVGDEWKVQSREALPDPGSKALPPVARES